ncbi:hypothetical protein [Bifidobacterium pseudolongum]|jgi:hypothetical protein|uniref:hypothetical protein n=1 Tax=Bifidobacterium pseudolongum TaxID=1694 RepID=UPI001F0E51E7|nr:hypothetical protein [Bifidobacterium pseudolongum]MCH4856207.1 hypothetical protein [Bifidobacterium pseudolongum]
MRTIADTTKGLTTVGVIEADQESNLRPGDLAVYAHPSDGIPRLCLPVVRVAEREDGSTEVTLMYGNCSEYKTSPDDNRFIRGYRFFDSLGCSRQATAFEYLRVVDRELKR